MKLKRKLLTALAAFSMMVPLALGVGGLGAGAAEKGLNEDIAKGNVSITLHKKKFNEEQNTKQNTGEIMSEFANADGLNSIEFTAYDASAKYYELLNTPKTSGGSDLYTPAEAVELLQTMELTNFTKVDPNGAKITAKLPVNVNGTVTEIDGIVNYHLPEEVTIGSKKQPAVYVFEETPKEGVSATGNSLRLVTVLPITVGEGNDKTILKDIHLYPKNKIIDRAITLKKFGTDGKAVTTSKFVLKSTSGTNTGKFWDGTNNNDTKVANFGTTAHEFALNKGTAQNELVIEGLLDGTYELVEASVGAPYELTEESQGITFTIKDGVIVDNNNAATGLTVEDNSKGVPEDAIDENLTKVNNEIHIENRALANFKFTKVDQATQKPLKDVTFNVFDAEDSTNSLYVFTGTLAEGQYKYLWKDEVDALSDTEKANWEEVLLTSTAEGLIEVKDVKLGTYYVKEKDALTGYIKLDAYIKASVTEAGQNKDGGNIDNVQEGILPSTGGAGIIAFLAIGAALMAGAFVWYKSSKKETTEV